MFYEHEIYLDYSRLKHIFRIEYEYTLEFTKFISDML